MIDRSLATNEVGRTAGRTVSAFLDDVGYRVIAERQVTQGSTRLFPPFDELHQRLSQLPTVQRLLFTLLWQGHVVSDSAMRSVVPGHVIDAFVRLALIGPQDGQWRSANCALAVFNGAYVVVSLPSQYPTSRSVEPQPALAAEIVLLQKLLPLSMFGAAVLVPHDPTGLLAVTCLRHGAARVHVTVIDSRQIDFLRASAHLNDCHGCLSAGVGGPADERGFDYVLGVADPGDPLPERLALARDYVKETGTIVFVGRAYGSQWDIEDDRRAIGDAFAGRPTVLMVFDKTPASLDEQQPGRYAYR